MIITTLVNDEDLERIAKLLGVSPRTHPLWMLNDFPGLDTKGYHWRDLVVALTDRVAELEARLEVING